MTRLSRALQRAFAGTFTLVLGCAAGRGPAARGPRDVPESVRVRLAALSPEVLPPLPPDVTNRYADDPRAAALGHKLFFETRFSGPLLDEANNGLPGTLGKRGDTGKVACASCHVPRDGFLDGRSPRRQVSLGSGWTRRRAPSLLNVARASFLMWDGRHDAAFSQIFTPIQDARELNSSPLFVAQQIQRLYRREFQEVFGALPNLETYPLLAAADAGCSTLPAPGGSCEKPGAQDEAVLRVVVNAGKAIQAYTRKLECGRGRFDRWMDGDPNALSAEERAGALLFVGKAGCDTCHSGPFMSDQRFYNVGLTGSFTFFVAPFQDPGAADGIPRALADPLGSTGRFSDGYDGRREKLPRDRARLLGAFRTPSLRCVGRRPSFMHTGQFRSLEDVVLFFNRGGDPPRGAPSGYLGVSENHARGLSASERAELVAFLRALDGDGPSPDLVTPPALP